MEKISTIVAGCTAALVLGLVLSGCSLLDANEEGGSTFSQLNPFAQQETLKTQEKSAETTQPAAPVVQPAAPEQPVVDETPKPSIRVDAAPAASTKAADNVSVNLGENAQCTTFCALPKYKKPTVQ